MKKISELTYSQALGTKGAEMAILIWPVLMTVMFVASIFLVIFPKIGEISETNTKKIAIEQKTKQNMDKRNYLLSVDQSEMENYAGLLESSIIRERDAYFLVNVMRRILDNHSFQIQSFLISPGEIKQDATKTDAKGGVKKIPITLSVSGPYDKYVDMLSEIERSLPIMSLDKMDMSSAGSLVKMDMVVSSYYLADKSDINVNNLSLLDLTLRKEEQDLFVRLSEFKPVVVGIDQGAEGEFVKYDRLEPFGN